MKKHFFGLSFFYSFWRLQIYEAVAAIFWQSASYVRFLIIALDNFRKVTHASAARMWNRKKNRKIDLLEF